ncbi:uncharacterized protein LOC134663418 [Cydia fagiglandana]|uniref:uncharacterized protein LOC134663418 n=1 Tax=Cydia fagiglandana TaxID=1458189 RepID=UPI002FEE477F
MSPLARSLLAFAALLAAVDAQGTCTTKIIGRRTDKEQPLGPVYIPYGRSEVQFNNYCPPPMHNVGERITVCNKTPGYPPAPPVIYDPPYGQITPVDIECQDPAGCIVNSVEYCDY